MGVVETNLASVIDSFQASQIISGGTRQQTPLVDTTWSYDGDINTKIEFGTNDGVTATWTSGSVLWDVADFPGLASGQAISYVAVDPGAQGIEFDTVAGNEVQFFLINQNASGASALALWFQPGGIVPLFRLAPIGRAYGSDWRTDLNALRTQVNAFRSGGPPGTTTASIQTLSKLKVFAWAYNRPTLTVNALGTVTTTLRPTVSWNFSPDAANNGVHGTAVQGSFRVRVFTAAQYGIGGFDPATSPATYDTGIVASASNSFTIPVNLVNGTTYRAYVIAAQTLPVSGYQHWTTDGTTWALLGAAAYTQFTMNLAPPPVPTVITPAAAASITTDLPVLGATLGASSVSGATVRAEWQLATDAGFTNNVRTVTEPVTDLRTSGATTEQMVQATHGELFQGTWYIRARELDSLGVYGSYSAAQSFTVSHPPTSANHSPTAQQTQKYAATNTFAWQFSDTSPTDAQTAFQLIIERDDTGVVQYDSGKQVSAANSFAVAISAALKGVLLRWKVRLYDSDDVVGPYSANQQFYVRDPGTITHVVPTSGGVIDNPQPTFDWDYTGSGYSQVAYQAVVKEDSTVIADSGFGTNATTSWQLPAALLQTGHSYTFELTIRDNYGLESTSTISFTAQWVPPPGPTITVDTSQFDAETDGYVRITWPENRDINFVNYKVYRRGVNDTTWTFAGTVDSTTDTTYEFRDYAAPANQQTYWAVTQSALRFSVPVESEIGSLTGNAGIVLTGASLGRVRWTSDVTPTTYSVAAWFKPTAAGLTQGVIGLNPAAGGSRTTVFYGGNITKFRLYRGDTFYNSPSNFPEGTWHHVALTVDATTANVYVNGVLELSQAVVAGDKLQSGDTIVIGAWKYDGPNYSNFFTGGVDEVQVFDKALTAAEVVDLATRPDDSVYAPLVLSLDPYVWWRLDETSGLVAADSSGNSRSGEYFTTGVTYAQEGVIGAIPLYTPVSTHYWLVTPDSPDDSLRLSMITSDQITDEWEREELMILGRGRRVERGTHWGIRGSLSAQVYDTPTKTASQIIDDLDGLQERNPICYLRNPFGKLYKVALGDISKDRVPGVGTNEYVTLSFDYVEVT